MWLTTAFPSKMLNTLLRFSQICLQPWTIHKACQYLTLTCWSLDRSRRWSFLQKVKTVEMVNQLLLDRSTILSKSLIQTRICRIWATWRAYSNYSSWQVCILCIPKAITEDSKRTWVASKQLCPQSSIRRVNRNWVLSIWIWMLLGSLQRELNL